MTEDSTDTDGALSDADEWVDLHGDYLYRNALLRVRDREVAEELVQETFLAALGARASFSGRSTERTWLMGILKHKVMDHYRRSARDLPLVEDERLPCEAEQPFEAGGEWRGHWRNDEGFGPRDWGPDPAGDLEKKEFWQVLRECLKALPDRLARVFSLREVDGCETEEICKVLDISATNLWVMLHRSRRQLRYCIERLWFAGDVEEGR